MANQNAIDPVHASNNLSTMKKFYYFLAISAVALQLISCKKDTVDTTATVTWSKTVSMSTKFEVPAIANRSETATATLELLSDNTLRYNIIVSGLAAGDAITAAHIHAANAGSTGAVKIGFDGTFTSTSVTGVTPVLRSGQIDTLKNMETYVNVHSTQVPSGLIRGQVDSKVVFAADVAMSGANEVPAVTTTATGLATIRITEDKKAYLKVNVTGLEAGDVLSAAHIHSGAAGVNGGVLLGFYAAAADFNTLKVLTVTDAVYNSLLNDAIYVNAHSVAKASGVVRGQVR